MTGSESGYLGRNLLCLRRAFSLVSRVTQLLQSDQRFDFSPQRFMLLNRPGIESWEQVNQWTGEGANDGIATLCQHAVSLGDAEFFVRNMPRQEFRNHQLLTRCPCNGPEILPRVELKGLSLSHCHSFSTIPLNQVRHVLMILPRPTTASLDAVVSPRLCCARTSRHPGDTFGGSGVRGAKGEEGKDAAADGA